MQGIFIIEGGVERRPKSKKEIRETAPEQVLIEATSLFGGEYAGRASHVVGKVYFVGPDPYTKRNFYGTIERVGGKVVVK